MIEISCTEANITASNLTTLTSGASNVFIVHFSFDSAWAGLEKAATFKAGKTVITVPIDNTDMTCAIPWECLREAGAILLCGVSGFADDVVLPTTYCKLGEIEKGAEYGEVERDPTVSIYEEFLTAAQNAEAIAQSVRDDANAGAFDGQDGAQGIQGIQGEQGVQGEPFQIKKTYSSINAMQADFDNMSVNDYVMIASSVSEEDNAKLYVKTDDAWVFISDFSGAQGIQGERGVQGIQGIQGVPGQDGYTPVRGVDYWTAADQAAVVAATIAALPDVSEVDY